MDTWNENINCHCCIHAIYDKYTVYNEQGKKAHMLEWAGCKSNKTICIPKLKGDK